MFSEAVLLPAATSYILEPSYPSSPTLSTSASPLSSAAHSRTSTITSNSCTRASLVSTNNSSRHMKIGKYFLEKTIGKGNFAVVKLATHADTHQKVAIKIIDKSRLDLNDQKKLEREIAVMKTLIHPYIIRLYEVMESKNLIYLVTEYAANGELLDLLIREKRFSEAKAKEKFRQLVLAVEYIHSKNIVHRDLKAENLLLDSNGNIKVADFGFANIYKPNSKLETFCGSPPYAAPELFQCCPYTPEKVDVWSLGVLLYIFVCGNLPFDGSNYSELRKLVLAGQYRLPFYISSDCGSLIGHMLTIDPQQRYTINDIKNHSWLMLNNTSVSDITCQTQTIPNCQLTNAILDHAESLGYDRTQILNSVNGNSCDSDAAIWHLLLDKFRETFHINHPENSNVETNHSDVVEHSTNVHDFIAKAEDTYVPPQQIIHINYIDNDSDDEASEQKREQYARTHGLRRHTIGRPDLIVHNELQQISAPKMRFTYQSETIEPSVLTMRLNHLQQRQECDPLVATNDNIDPCYSQSQPFPAHQQSSHPFTTNIYNRHQEPQQWLSPPVTNNFFFKDVNRRASDGGANLGLFQKQSDVTDLNTIGTIPSNHMQSSLSNQSLRGSITRGAPLLPPTCPIAFRPNEENDDDDEETSLARYLNFGKRHTVCEQAFSLGGKVRRNARETFKDRGSLSRRASDTSSNLINNSMKTHLEHLYRNAVGTKFTDEDRVTTSSLQELHQLQKQIQKYSANNNSNNSLNSNANTVDSPIVRRASAVPSPTNLTGLHMIREENQQNSIFSTSSQHKSSSSSSSSSEALQTVDTEEYNMDCDANHNLQQPNQEIAHSSIPFYRACYRNRAVAPYCCNTNAVLAQNLSVHTTTSYMP